MSKDHGHAHYAGFRFRMAITVVMVSLLPLALVSGIILYQFNAFSNEMVRAHLGELVVKHSQNIDDFVNQRLDNIKYMSRNFDPEQLRDCEFLRQQLKALQEEYGLVFVDLGLVNAEGRQTAYSGPFDLLRADYSGAEWFQEARLSEEYISDVFSGLRGEPHFIVAVKRQWGGAEWLLRATIDFASFNTLVANLSVGKTGTAFILNRAGEFQTRPPKGELKLTKQQYLNLFNKSDQALLSDQQSEDRLESGSGTAGKRRETDGIRNQAFNFEKIDPQGDKFVVVVSFLKNREWLLIFQQEYVDAFAKLKRTQKTAGFISFLAAVTIILVALIVSNRMARRIGRLHSEKEIMNQQIIETGKLASVGELAAGIAHEINNPVAIMVEEAGWLQDLMDDGIKEGDNLDEFKRALQQIQTQGRRCKEITHKLLSFARKTDSRVQAIQLNELITEVVDLLSQKSRYANVAVQVRLQPDLPAIQASVTEMQQVLMNILHNAVDAMEKTGGRIIITSESAADQIRVSIEDTGPGIPAGNLGRIFDPFFTTKPVGKGTGLGLSICYGIVHKMGGRIEVESEVDKGTTFHIMLPLNQPAVPNQ